MLVFFYLERPKTLFLGQMCLQKHNKEISKFWQKQWTNPIAKMQILQLFKKGLFMVKKG